MFHPYALALVPNVDNMMAQMPPTLCHTMHYHTCSEGSVPQSCNLIAETSTVLHFAVRVCGLPTYIADPP